jgi:hypothetical protein
MTAGGRQVSPTVAGPIRITVGFKPRADGTFRIDLPPGIAVVGSVVGATARRRPNSPGRARAPGRVRRITESSTPRCGRMATQQQHEMAMSVGPGSLPLLPPRP